MYEYIKGKKIEMTPTEIIVEAGGIGYSAAISLQTYDSFQGLEEVKVYLHHHIHEDDEEFYDGCIHHSHTGCDARGDEAERTRYALRQD